MNKTDRLAAICPPGTPIIGAERQHNSAVLIDPQRDGSVVLTFFRFRRGKSKRVGDAALNAAQAARALNAIVSKRDCILGDVLVTPNPDGSVGLALVGRKGKVLAAPRLPAGESADTLLGQLAGVVTDTAGLAMAPVRGQA